MPLKILVMMLGQSTLRRDDDISMINDDTMQDLQLVIMGQLKGITD